MYETGSGGSRFLSMPVHGWAAAPLRMTAPPMPREGVVGAGWSSYVDVSPAARAGSCPHGGAGRQDEPQPHYELTAAPC
jgi:hypothetical protein